MIFDIWITGTGIEGSISLVIALSALLWLSINRAFPPKLLIEEIEEIWDREAEQRMSDENEEKSL